MKIDHEERAKGTETGSGSGVESIEELEVVISSEGTVIFSWNHSDIQTLARLLGIPEFDPPRWCG